MDLSGWNASVALGAKIRPFATFPSWTPFKRPLRKRKTTYFKLTLPTTKSELSVAQWTSGTPEQFLLHVRAVIYACKQMELEVNFSSSRAQEAVATEELNLDVAKEAYVQVCTSKKKW